MLCFNWSPPLGGRMGRQQRSRVPAPTHPALTLELTCLLLNPARSRLAGLPQLHLWGLCEEASHLTSTPTVPRSASAPVLSSP